MNKKLIIWILAGMVSFAGAFSFSWLTKTTEQKEDLRADTSPQGMKTEQHQQGPEEIPELVDSELKRNLTEKQLKGLIYDFQAKMREYENKIEMLEKRNERRQVAKKTLEKDLEDLENLRGDLASTVTELKDQRRRLNELQVKINQQEKTNLVNIGSTYDRMDPKSASKILMSMSKAPDGQYSAAGAGFEDAVKILYYMDDRTRANLLAELTEQEAQLAALFCKKLKHVEEQK